LLAEECTDIYYKKATGLQKKGFILARVPSLACSLQLYKLLAEEPVF
jgi:hypothetical protein